MMLNAKGIPYLGLMIGILVIYLVATSPCHEGLFIGMCGLGQMLVIIAGCVWTTMYLVALLIVRRIKNPWGKLVSGLAMATLLTFVVIGGFFLGLRLEWW